MSVKTTLVRVAAIGAAMGAGVLLARGLHGPGAPWAMAAIAGALVAAVASTWSKGAK